MTVSASQSKCQSIDVLVQLHLRREQLRADEKDASAGGMTVASRIVFDALKADVEMQVISTRQRQV